MYFSSILIAEIGIAILLLLAVFWLKPEYGLLVYGLALGFPDVAIPVGTAINIRVDDILIAFFLVRSFLWIPAPMASGQRKILRWQALLIGVCAASAIFGFASGAPPALYDTIKMIGCAAIVVVLPRLVQSETRLRFLVAGLMCAGFALVIQIVRHLAGSPLGTLSNFQELKNAATFTTWNPNTTGQAAMLFVFTAGLGWIVFPRNRLSGAFWFYLATVFALTPMLVFARGTSLSIAAGYLIFLFLARRWKQALAFLVIGISIFGYMRSVDRVLVDGATRVDLASGEGFSHRFDRWDMAIEAIRAEPLLGYGFGQEWTLLSGLGSEGRAHNAYMSVYIEVGFGGLALLFAIIYQYFSVGLSLFRQTEFQQGHLSGALLLALVLAVCLDSVGLPTLYWEKLPTIALSIGIALIGMCERNCDGAFAQNASAAAYEAFPAHLRI